MQKVFYKYIIALVIFPGLLNSCSKKLNELPPHTLIVENAIKDQATAEIAVNGIYSYFGELSELDAFSITNQALRSNLVEVSTQRSGYETELNALSVESSWVYIKNLWVITFKVINTANNVIDQLEKFEETDFAPGRKNQMLGEARFLRGYAHLYQMKMFTHFWDIDSEFGPLIRLEPAGLNNNSKTRSSVSEGYETVLEDLRFASENAPDFFSVFRSSKGLAKAYIVETLLLRGAPGDFQEAAQLAEDVITNSGVTLETTFPNIYSKAYTTTELMFSRKIKPENIGLNDLSANVATVFSLLGKKRNGPNYKYFEYVTPQDTRYASIIGTLTDANNVTYANTWRKHFNASGDVPTRFMRLTQMYLYKAEALFRSGAPVAEVLAPLNVLRLRANMPVYDASLVSSHDDIVNILFYELLVEVGVENGSEFFAAVRLKNSLGERLIKELNPNYVNDNQLALPIPDDELLFNLPMKPNP